jgi:hypothetical protein
MVTAVLALIDAWSCSQVERMLPPEIETAEAIAARVPAVK